MKYSMTCSCGDVMAVEAASREEAVSMLKGMMSQEAMDQHWADKHASDESPKPSLDEAHAMIDQNTVEAAA